MSTRTSRSHNRHRTSQRFENFGWIVLAISAGVCAAGMTAPASAQVVPPGASPASMPAPSPATQPASMPATAPNPLPPKPVGSPAEGPTFLSGKVLPKDQLLLNFQNAPLRSVLDFLSKATGVVIVGEPVLEGRVTVISRKPIRLSEAVLLLDTVLRQKGYAAVYTGRNLKIVSLAQAAKENIPVLFGKDPNATPETDRIVTQVIPVRSVDATKLLTDLKPLMPATAVTAANQASNSMIMTDTQANIRKILKVIAAIEGQQASESQVKVYKLEYADATSTAELIAELFKEDTSSQQQGQMRFPFFGRPGSRGGDRSRGSSSSSSTASARQVEVTATADTRTNSMVVVASPETLRVIDGIIKEIDSNEEGDVAVFIYKLKNADAANVEDVVNNIFGTTSGSSRSTSTGSSRLSSSNRSTGFSSSSSSTSRFNNTSSAARSTGGNYSSALSSSSDLTGEVFVVADEDTNSLLVRTSSRNIERVKAILDDLDRPIRQVLIKALLAEITHDDSTDLGVEFSALNIRAGSAVGSIGTDYGVAAASGGLVTKVVDVDYTVALRALQSVGKLNVLSRPYILTSDNQEASITVGNEVPFIRDSRLTDTGQTINTIEYEDIGIILTVLPHINPEGLVIMDVEPEISTQTGTTVPISETVNAPVFAKRSASTRIAIRNGQTIVIGGLMEDRITDTVEKVPWFGDMPGPLGALFRRTIKDKAKTELLIFLTPHVAALPEQLKGMTKDETAHVKEFKKPENKSPLDEQIKGMKAGATTMPASGPTTMPVILFSNPDSSRSSSSSSNNTGSGGMDRPGGGAPRR